MEKVRLFQRMLENLYAVTSPTRKFVKKYFSPIDDNWFEIYVRKPNRNKPQYKDVKKLRDMDLIKLLDLLQNSRKLFEEKYPLENKFKDATYYDDLIKATKEVRGYVAHLEEDHYKFYSDFKNDETVLENYAIFLGTTLDDCKRELYEEENQEILDFVFEKTSDQAIEIEDDFPPDIIESIKHTKEVLRSKKTAKDIIDFIEDALKNSEKGKRIATEVKKRGLDSFEDIAVQVREMYYGIVSKK